MSSKPKINKNEPRPRPKPQHYTVKLEVMAPVELEFRILAEDPQQALEKVSRGAFPPLSKTPRPILNRMRRIKARVYRFGNSVMETWKNF